MRMRRVAAIILSITLCLCAVQPAFGASGTFKSHAVSGGNIYYFSDGKAVTIESADAGITAAAIPEKIGGVPVTAIANSAFSGCKNLKSITIPATVNEIGGYAFYETPWLDGQTQDFVTVNNILLLCRSTATEINIPVGTVKIAPNAFYLCAKRFSVTVPSTVKTIDYDAFLNCTALTDITLSYGLNYINDGAFNGCTSLSSVSVPSTVSSVGALAFYNCTALKNVSLPTSLKAIDYQVFSGCSRLTDITLPSNLTAIGNGAFKGCTSLTDIVLPQTVKTISAQAFLGCSAMTELNIPPSVTSIGSNAVGYRAADKTVSGFTVGGKKGSAAETYAEDNALKFTNKNFAAVVAASQFKDVQVTAWYFPYVSYAAQKGLVNGKNITTYAPSGNMTYAEAVKLAACMHQLYTKGSVTLKNGSPWYQSYADYAEKKGIIPQGFSPIWNDTVTRGDFAVIFAAALPKEAMSEINTVSDGAIVDVDMSSSYADSVYLLYRAGIAAGSGADFSFKPSSGISRSEVAAIVTRMMDADQRISGLRL